MNRQTDSLTPPPRILGIDPGIHRTGWAVLSGNLNSPDLIAYGCIVTLSSQSEIDRLADIASNLNQICTRYSCDQAAVEKLYVAKNIKTVMAVSQARGVVLMTLAQNHCLIAEYTPLQIKQALTGYGRADKKQIQYMVKSLLKLKKIPQPDDAADAIAIAICHQQSYKLNQKLT